MSTKKLMISMILIIGISLLSAGNLKLVRSGNISELDLTNSDRDFTPTDPPVGVVRQTSEFEQMEGVLVVYPIGIPYSLIAEMSNDIVIYTIVDSYLQSQCETSYQNNGVNMANCEFINASSTNYWIRDYGPWFISVDNELAIVNFPNNDDISIEVANYLELDIYGMDLVIEGGNYMCDGNSVGASTDLVFTLNPSLTPTQIDQLFLDYLGIETYHVTIDPLDNYIKHIDCWGKFLDVDKVLIGQVPASDYRYEDFEFVANYFADQTSAWGNNYEIYRIYTPGSYSQPTPYTNSLILNNKVFVPQSGSQWDDEAIAVYEEAMPGYEIIGIFSNDWYDTDAIHCRTRGIADRNMLYIQHDPILGEVQAGEDIDVIAQIIPYSGEDVYTDSLLMKYKINDGNFNAIIMTFTGNDSYLAVIPDLDPNSEISYYIHAADESGHSANHPIIGEFEPHIFTVTSTASQNDVSIIGTELLGNFPNPFNPTTTISFSVAQTSSFVTLEIYNLKGQKVKTLDCSNSFAATSNKLMYSIVWDGTDDNNQPVSSGIYLYKLQAGEFSQTKKMILLK